MYEKSSVVVIKKQRGQYFTDPVIARHIVTEICDQIFLKYFWNPLKILKERNNYNEVKPLLDKILNLRIVDPSMGNGVFLIEIISYFTNFLFNLNEYINQSPLYEVIHDYFDKKLNLNLSTLKSKNTKSLDIWKLFIIRSILYGVDLDAKIVKQAKNNILTVFHHPEIREIAKNLISQNYKQGNSLISPIQFDQKSRNHLLNKRSSDIETLLRIRKFFQETQWNKFSYKQISKLANQFNHITEIIIDQLIEENLLLRDLIQLNISSESIQPYFCWQLAFPEIFFNKINGFDIVLGNPPWDKWKLYNREWLGSTALSKPDHELEVIKVREMNSEANDEYINLKRFYYNSAKYFSKYYKYQPGEKNLYKLFIERFFDLCRTRGSLCIIIPGGFLGEFYCQSLRNLILLKSQILLLVELISNAEIFPEIESGLSILVLFVKKDKPSENFPFIKGINSIDAFLTISLKKLSPSHDNIIHFSSSDIIERSPRNIIPAVRNQKELLITQKIMDNPALSSNIWGCKTSRGIDMTNDKYLFSKFPTNHPLIEGRHLVRLGFDNCYPRYWITSFEEYKKKIPFWNETIIVWKNFSGNHRRRRMRIAILPPKTAISNSVICLYRIPNIKDIEYYLAGIMCSIPFEFRIRQLCYGLNINQYIIDNITVPFIDKSNFFHNKLIEIVKKFIPQGKKWAKQKIEAKSPLEKARLELQYQDILTKIDSLVALVYGLSLSDFDITIRAHTKIESTYRDKALTHYETFNAV